MREVLGKTPYPVEVGGERMYLNLSHSAFVKQAYDARLAAALKLRWPVYLGVSRDVQRPIEHKCDWSN